MRAKSVLSVAFSLGFCLLPEYLMADVLCHFTTRSDVERTIKLSGPAYAIRREGDSLILEARMRDGRRHPFGTVIPMASDEFTVYLHIPEADTGSSGAVMILTIHESGKASLVQHHGSWGNLSQDQRAWTYQGDCSNDP